MVLHRKWEGDIKLYGVPGWWSATVETMLAQVGQPCAFVDAEGFNRKCEAQDRLAAVNPLRQVPTLVLEVTQRPKLGDASR